jgi:hypothetical protein
MASFSLSASTVPRCSARLRIMSTRQRAMSPHFDRSRLSRSALAFSPLPFPPGDLQYLPSAAGVLENVNKQIVQMFFKADVTQRGGRHREPNRRPTNNAPVRLRCGGFQYLMLRLHRKAIFCDDCHRIPAVWVRLTQYALAAFIWCTFLVALLIAWNT